MALTHSTESHAVEASGEAPGLLEYCSHYVRDLGTICLKHYPTAGLTLISDVPWEWLYRPKPRHPKPPHLPRPRRRSNRRRSARNVWLRCRHARLAFMWTLTYRPTEERPDGPESRAVVMRDAARCVRLLKKVYPGLRALWVPERGAKGGRLHAHLAVDRFLSYEVVARIWGLGHVFVGDPQKLPGRPGARRLANYLAKYITKELEHDDLLPEERSYGCSRGWAVPCHRRRFWAWDAAEGWRLQVYGPAEREGTYGGEEGGLVRGRWKIYADAALWPPWDDVPRAK